LPDAWATIGSRAWAFVGVTAAILILAAFLVLSAGITVPLILAVVIGMIAYPLAERLKARGLNAAAAALVVLLLLVAIIVATVWITVTGIVLQWPEISANAQAGLAEVADTMTSLGFDPEAAEAAVRELMNAESGDSALTGIASTIFASLASGLSGIFGFFFGLFISVTLLYYILADFPTVSAWVASHMGLPQDLGEGVVEDAIGSMRGYFRGTTLTGLAVAALIAAGAWILGVPLAFSIGLVTFITCYVPFFGAIISGAFAFIIALGSGGLTQALILLVIVLVAQNVLQTVINARFMGESLSLHPIVVLVVTMLGGTFGGLLGAALAAPLTALGVRAAKRLSAYGKPALPADAEAAPASLP
jgi:predicted PurR-regulated permease PerM